MRQTHSYKDSENKMRPSLEFKRFFVIKRPHKFSDKFQKFWVTMLHWFRNKRNTILFTSGYNTSQKKRKFIIQNIFGNFRNSWWQLAVLLTFSHIYLDARIF